MSKFQGHLITTISSALALLAFFFLPYLAFTFPDGSGSEAFTGLQMIGINAQPSASSNSLLHSFQMLWVQPALMAVVLLIAAIHLTRLGMNRLRNEMAAQRGALWVLVVGGFILLMLLCRYFSDSQSMISLIGSKGLTEAPGGSLYSLGYWGFCVGAVLAVVGGWIALRAER